jgi:CO/xanthine dehydrogenase FAD-binding subunit
MRTPRTERLPSEKNLDDEDEYGLDKDAVTVEASRCFDCGCVAVNPSDIAPALIALQAKIATTRRTINADDFFDAGPMRSTILEQAELVTEVEIPARNALSKQAFLKFGRRKAVDFAVVNVACALNMKGTVVSDARLVMGTVAPVPLRAKTAEDLLKGKVLTEQLAEAAAEAALRNATPLSKNKYKVMIAKSLIKTAISNAVGGAF